jgi:hypothetical protein
MRREIRALNALVEHDGMGNVRELPAHKERRALRKFTIAQAETFLTVLE